MNRRDFLGLIPSGAITAALTLLGLRKPEAKLEWILSPDDSDCELCSKTTIWGKNKPPDSERILGTGIDAISWCDQSDYIVAGVDPASPDGDYAAVATMEQTPDGWIVTDWEDKA